MCVHAHAVPMSICFTWIDAKACPDEMGLECCKPRLCSQLCSLMTHSTLSVNQLLFMIGVKIFGMRKVCRPSLH